MTLNRYQFRLREGPAIMAMAMAMAMAMFATEAIGQEVPVQAAEAPAGQVGQRQTRDKITPNAEPMARINNRIQSRVQLRIQNRIDRFYSPQAKTTSSFEAANTQVQKSGPSRPR